MSETLDDIILKRRFSDFGSSERIAVSSFHGGTHDGPCMQISLENEYAQLTRDEVERVRDNLNRWLEKHR